MFYEQDHMVVGYTYAIITEFCVFASRWQSMADHYLSWVNLQRKPCSHELFISYFNTFLFVLTNCFTTNQISDTVV